MGPEALPEPPARKKRRVTTRGGKGFKKDFDPPPSTLANRPPSSHRCTPFKSMVAGWWLQGHPHVKTLGGATWLVGFYSRLKEDDLHPVDRGYLDELIAWHEEKGSQSTDE
jgi:hypothetical protein